MQASNQNRGENDTAIFIADLHLCEARPQMSQCFVQFLEQTATQVDALYILGDLFEYWLGDDNQNTHDIAILTALKQLAQHTQVYFMHGNRDFLISEKICQQYGVALLADPHLIQLGAHRVLLSHGDDLCTDDTAYQTFRVQVRNPQWQTQFLSQPLAVRQQLASQIRQKSEQEKTVKSEAIMDVNADALIARLHAFDCPDILIHGHTHRPAQHTIALQNKKITRWVLGDWYEAASYLVWKKGQFQTHTMALSAALSAF